MVKQMGVDPGARGALATLDSEELTLRIDSMPTRQFRRKNGRLVTQVNARTLAQLVVEHGADAAILEEVGARPDEGAVSSFSFGDTFGSTRTVLELAEIELELVLPSKWKRETGTPADKHGAIARADTLFPLCKKLWRGPRGGLQHDRAEAAVMALYGLVTRGVTLRDAFRPIGD